MADYLTSERILALVIGPFVLQTLKRNIRYEPGEFFWVPEYRIGELQRKNCARPVASYRDERVVFTGYKEDRRPRNPSGHFRNKKGIPVSHYNIKRKMEALTMKDLKDLTSEEKLNQLLEGMQILLDKVRALHQALAVHDDATTKHLNYVIGEMNVLAGQDDGHDVVKYNPVFSMELHPPDSEGD